MAEQTIQIADKPTLDLINQKIGATADTGGNSTTGTLMAKMNSMLSSNNNLISFILGDENYTSYCTFSNTLSANQQLVNVNGTGLFSGAVCTATSGTGRKINMIIEIDGKIFNFTDTGSQYIDGSGSGLFNKNYLALGDYGDAAGYSGFCGVSLSSSFEAIPYIGNNNDKLMFTLSEIPFQQNLKISTGTSVGGSIAYLYHIKNN